MKDKVLRIKFKNHDIEYLIPKKKMDAVYYYKKCL